MTTAVGVTQWRARDLARRIRNRHLDLADVRGQRLGRRALEVAAAGGHHLLLVGPAGSGKTMLAERLPGLLPDLSRAEALEVSRVHSAAGLPLSSSGLIVRPPFRAPHHGASAVSLVGGGTWSMRRERSVWRAGGCSSSTRWASFPPPCSMLCANPSRRVSCESADARGTVVYPARFLLVGAMNPCPCGEGCERGIVSVLGVRSGPLSAKGFGAVAGPLRPGGQRRPDGFRRAPGRRAR